MQNILKRVNTQYLVLFLLFVVTIVTMLLNARFMSVEAAQLTSRSLSLSSNLNSGTATYTLTFTTSSTTGGVEMAICTTPLAGTTCAAPAGFSTAGVAVTSPAGFVLGTDSACVLGTSGTCNAPRCSVVNTTTAPLSTNTIASSGNTACGIRVHHPTVAAAGGATTVTLTGITNPTAVGTFFVRIATYDGINNTYTTFEDNGTVAQSVRAATNVSFKVQEILQVCAGATTVNTNVAALGTGNTCDGAGVTGYLAAVDLGVADPATVRVSPVATGGTTQGNNTNGFVLIRTNASGATTVQYRPIINTSSWDLKVASATCAQVPSTSTTDACINSAPITAASGAGSAIVAGTEEFGMTVPFVNRTAGGATTALNADNGYFSDGVSGGSCTVNAGATIDNNCWVWASDGNADTLASASGPVDDEAIILKFASAVGLTTPTGLFQANLDLFAVSTY